MAFYDLSKSERQELTQQIIRNILVDLEQETYESIQGYFSDEDTYIRKTAYLAIGRLFYENPKLQKTIFTVLNHLMTSENELVRQTVINSAGEIGKFHFDKIQTYMEEGLFDKHHRVRNAVIGSIKKMSEVNPQPVLSWAKPYLKHPDKEVRREICHGIELRGRTHPQDILPLLQFLEFDETKRVRDTLVHVLGQISYKNGCLKTVIAHLNTWNNTELVNEAIDEIVDVHYRYKKFAVLSQDEAIAYIDKNYNN